MITTLDGVIKQRGESVWEIGFAGEVEGYRPTRSIVHGQHNRLINPDRCWNNWKECSRECFKMNEEFNKHITVRKLKNNGTDKV